MPFISVSGHAGGLFKENSSGAQSGLCFLMFGHYFTSLCPDFHRYTARYERADRKKTKKQKQKQKNNFTVFPKKSDIHNSYVILKEQHEPMLFIDAWLLYPFVMGMFLLHIRICN